MTKPSRCFSIAQFSLQCECAHNRTERPTKQLPHCAPSALCATSNASDEPLRRRELLLRPPDAPSSDVDGGSSFVIVYHYNATRVRYWYRSDPFRSYLSHMRLICRLVLSLRDVNASLPINLLVSGQRDRGFEAGLVSRLGVGLIDADSERHRIKTPKA